jgi:glycosyltransferase involved in cell wall biosynthesis
MWVYRGLERIAFARYTDGTICVSQSLSIQYQRLGDQRRISVIPNAVSTFSWVLGTTRERLRESLGVSPLQHLIGAVGRLSPIKRLDRFLEVARRLTTDLPNARFLIVGDGPEKKRLQDLAANNGLDKRIIFVGHVPDAQPFMTALDCLLLTSDNEGMPSVVLEAMALSVPVIAFRVGGIPELVVDGETGRLVPRADVAAMISAVRELLVDPELRTRYGKSGCERVRKHFSAIAIARQTMSLYRDLFERANRA